MEKTVNSNSVNGQSDRVDIQSDRVTANSDRVSIEPDGEWSKSYREGMSADRVTLKSGRVGLFLGDFQRLCEAGAGLRARRGHGCLYRQTPAAHTGGVCLKTPEGRVTRVPNLSKWPDSSQGLV
jgi:hypothetical protein